MFGFFQKSPVTQPHARQGLPAASSAKAQAHFDIIGLANVRDKHGAQWQVISGHVHKIVCLIIKQHLQDGESFDLLPPDQYVVTFLRSPAESTVAAERIRQNIISVFLKDTTLENILDIGVHEKSGMVPLPPSIEFPFRPVWGIGKDMPGCFCVMIRRTADDGTILKGYDVLQENAQDDDSILELDLRTLRKLRIAMNATLRNCGTPARMLCPIHFRTLADERGAAVYAEAFTALHENGISNYVSLQLMHMPRKLAGVELESIIHAARCITKHFVVMTPLDRSERDGLAQAGVTAVGLDLSPYTRNPPADLQQRMLGFTKIAHRERMRTFVIGLEREDLVVAAKEASFTHMCGDALQAGTGTEEKPKEEPAPGTAARTDTEEYPEKFDSAGCRC